MQAIVMFIVIIGVTVALIKSVNTEKYKSLNKLDRLGIATNIVLSVMYIGMSLMCVFLAGFIWDSPIKDNVDETSRTIATWVMLTISVPSLIGIVLSILLRRMGKSVASFIIQFLPIAVFIIGVFCSSMIAKIIIGL